MPSKAAAGGSAAAPVEFNLRATARLPPDVEQEFLAGPWNESLSSIPNLGAATEAKLKAAGILNTYNLCGKFLQLKTEGDNSQSRCSAFCAFMLEAGISKGLLSVLTYAVAKKLNRSFPGFLCVWAGGGPLPSTLGPLSPSPVPLTHLPTHYPPAAHLQHRL